MKAKPDLQLWSIQEPAVWEALRTRGEFRASWAGVRSAWRHAYGWMCNQMERRLGPSATPSPMPLWAWQYWGGTDQPRPDLRCRAHLPRGARGVRLELKVPPGRVLLSDFELWHYVINGWYLPANRADERRFERAATSALPPRHRVRQIETSWERIFELEVARSPYYTAPPSKRSVQAVFWELRVEDVVKVDEFVAR